MSSKLAGLPVWAWAAAAVAGLALGYLVIRSRRHATEQAPARTSSSGSNLTADELASIAAGLQPQSGGQNASPADSLSAQTLGLLASVIGIETDALVTQGQTLSSVALGAQDALSAISQTTVTSAFELARAKVEMATWAPPQPPVAPPSPAPSPPVAPPGFPITYENPYWTWTSTRALLPSDLFLPPAGWKSGDKIPLKPVAKKPKAKAAPTAGPNNTKVLAV